MPSRLTPTEDPAINHDWYELAMVSPPSPEHNKPKVRQAPQREVTKIEANASWNKFSPVPTQSSGGVMQMVQPQNWYELNMLRHTGPIHFPKSAPIHSQRDVPAASTFTALPSQVQEWHAQVDMPAAQKVQTLSLNMW